MDRRELILARLLEIAEDIPGIRNAYRNQDEINESQRPAILILDADEQAEDRDGGRLGRRPTTPTRVGMTPEIYIMLAGTPASVGTSLNGFRASLIAAILGDETLGALTGTNGEILYLGAATSLARGRQAEGSMGLSFTFTYPLIPSEIQAEPLSA
jgi:hypothetical protein